MADEEEETAPTEGDREWREQTQQTEELAEELAPPHDRDTERGDPSPNS